MKTIAFVLALLAARSVAAAESLEDRVKFLAESDNQTIRAVVYDRYPSGRPRRVVAVIGEISDGTLYLLRFPDARSGKPRVLDRATEVGGSGPLELQKVIDPKDVVVDTWMRHGTNASVYRVADDHLVLLTDTFGEAIDLDGDGVPEVLSAFYAGTNECGVATSAYLQKWNGKKFVSDDRSYVDLLIDANPDDVLLLSAEKRYAVRLFGPGRVLLDDEALTPGKPFRTESGCHTIALRGGAERTRVLLEELR